MPLTPLRPLRVAASITPHGFGHAAIMLAVLDALEAAIPQGLDVTFVTAVPEAVLRARWGRPCSVVPHAAPTDFGMLMASSTEVRVQESLAAHVEAHANWEDVVEREAALLAQARPDVVLTCVSHAALAAARRLGRPGVGLGPFTWREILAAYADGSAAVEEVLDLMRDAYAAADAMIGTTPAVPMDLPNLRRVGPVGLPGRVRKDALDAYRGERVALVALGGITEDLPVHAWPAVEGWRWVVPDRAQGGRMVPSLQDLGLSVSDAIASVDAVITKPGYGTFVEAGCAGTPLIYRERPDWPETEGMARWLSAHAPCIGVDAETFATGQLRVHLQKLLQEPPRPRARPTGNREAAELILDVLGLTGREPGRP